MCGSSARKLRRGHANLLGGRALRFEMFGLTSVELADKFDITKLCNRGNIPNHYASDSYWELLENYVRDYLKEEIAAEALVRNLPSFFDFLRASALCDTELVDYTNIASDCGVKSPTVKNYYEILCDTLQGFFVHAYTRKPKRKIVHAPKFYYANVGVVNWLARRRLLEPGSIEFGKAFENVIVNEIRAWNSYRKAGGTLTYWKLATGEEVDLVLPKHLSGLRELGCEQPKFKSKMLVCLEPVARMTDDKIMIYPLDEFLDLLWVKNLGV